MSITTSKGQIVYDKLGYAICKQLEAYSTVFDAEIGGLSCQNTVFLDESDLDSVSCDGPTP